MRLAAKVSPATLAVLLILLNKTVDQFGGLHHTDIGPPGPMAPISCWTFYSGLETRAPFFYSRTVIFAIFHIYTTTFDGAHRF